MKINQKLEVGDFKKNCFSIERNQSCREVLNLFNKVNVPYLTITGVSNSLGILYHTAKSRLHRLVNMGKIKRIYPGAYCLPKKQAEIKLLPLYVKMNKFFIITVPAKIVNLRNLKNSFVKIIIEKDGKKSRFLTKTYYSYYSHQTRVFVNEEIRGELNINPNDIFRIIDICKIFSFKSKKEIFRNGLVDLLSLIPEKTKKGFDFLVEEFIEDNEKWLNLWYHPMNGGSKQVKLKRFVDPEKLGNLFGIFQAEGTKFEKVKNDRSVKLNFANKSISEHKQFIDNLNGFGVSRELIKADVYYNPSNVKDGEYKAYIDRFEKLTGIRFRTHYVYPNKKKLYYAIQLMVERAALAELFLNAMDKIRITIANKKLNKSLCKLGESFLSKLLTGDGCLVTVKGKGDRGYITQGYISDKNLDYRKDYRKILRKFGFSVANWDDGKRVYFACNNENLKFLYRIKAFKGTRSWKKLLKALLLKNKKLHQRLRKLNQFSEFTNQQFSHIFEISFEGAVLWMRNNREKRYFDILKICKRRYYYVLSDKGMNLLDFLNDCELELQKCC